MSTLRCRTRTKTARLGSANPRHHVAGGTSATDPGIQQQLEASVPALRRTAAALPHGRDAAPARTMTSHMARGRERLRRFTNTDTGPAPWRIKWAVTPAV